MNERHTNHYINEKRRIANGVKDNTSALYRYSIDTNSYAEMWYKMHHDLGYPLKVDSKYRRAIIYNKQGLEKQIQDMIQKVIGDNLGTLADIVADDITAQLNSLTQSANGQLVKSKTKSNMGTLIGKALGNGLVKGFNDILNDITDINRRNKR